MHTAMIFWMLPMNEENISPTKDDDDDMNDTNDDMNDTNDHDDDTNDHDTNDHGDDVDAVKPKHPAYAFICAQWYYYHHPYHHLITMIFNKLLFSCFQFFIKLAIE
jgi:hypothetical protein